ncbi:hypothetical protein TRFO_20529 [Tritrichomonas foetus]|uniref:Uncharacterized protein n=1 Tax=Tritrichomonas foetus TaxID=1144522 RepID=A0A1J4KKK8_9EUKA|nr:hypothetical protein TRFO_20529 [Tritrichomonas foetus]|eukprot:OHT10230.1 hypothetical protein TRFO_20529 [Tritrichomonas foetus]
MVKIKHIPSTICGIPVNFTQSEKQKFLDDKTTESAQQKMLIQKYCETRGTIPHRVYDLLDNYYKHILNFQKGLSITRFKQFFKRMRDYNPLLKNMTSLVFRNNDMVRFCLEDNEDAVNFVLTECIFNGKKWILKSKHNDSQQTDNMDTLDAKPESDGSPLQETCSNSNQHFDVNLIGNDFFYNDSDFGCDGFFESDNENVKDWEVNLFTSEGFSYF